MAKSNEKDAAFILTGTDGGFSQRSQGIFDSLNTIEAKHEANQSVISRQNDDAKLLKDDPPEEWPLDTSTVSKSGSRGFKRPHGMPPKAKSVPDYMEHPEKYTKYDLDDVPKDAMSERSNAAAALEFLRSRAADKVGLKDDDDDPMDGADHTQKMEEERKDNGQEKPPSKDIEDRSYHTASGARHLFKKPVERNPTKPPSRSDVSDDKATYVGGRFMMPEYVVGSKPKDATKQMKSGSQPEDQSSSASNEDSSGSSKMEPIPFKARNQRSRHQFRVQDHKPNDSDDDDDDDDDEHGEDGNEDIQKAAALLRLRNKVRHRGVALKSRDKQSMKYAAEDDDDDEEENWEVEGDDSEDDKDETLDKDISMKEADKEGSSDSESPDLDEDLDGLD